MERLTALDIARMIDHSLLNPKFTEEEIRQGCELAKEYHCATVCVRPCDVPGAMDILKDSDVLVTTVIGFPHGSNLTAVKVYEAELAIRQGCKEIDMVLNIGQLLSGEYDKVEADIRAVAEKAHASNVTLKVILENSYLTDEQKIAACGICERAGADYTKTSTGYAPSGATLHDLRLMRKYTPSRMKVKAAGGVRKLDDALLVRAVGASRFGCTRTKEMLDEAARREKEGTLILPEVDENTEFAWVLQTK
jgi:deoxyribose-phosphate aldolase